MPLPTSSNARAFGQLVGVNDVPAEVQLTPARQLPTHVGAEMEEAVAMEIDPEDLTSLAHPTNQPATGTTNDDICDCMSKCVSLCLILFDQLTINLPTNRPKCSCFFPPQPVSICSSSSWSFNCRKTSSRLSACDARKPTAEGGSENSELVQKDLQNGWLFSKKRLDVSFRNFWILFDVSLILPKSGRNMYITV